MRPLRWENYHLLRPLTQRFLWILTACAGQAANRLARGLKWTAQKVTINNVKSIRNMVEFSCFLIDVLSYCIFEVGLVFVDMFANVSVCFLIAFVFFSFLLICCRVKKRNLRLVPKPQGS